MKRVLPHTFRHERSGAAILVLINCIPFFHIISRQENLVSDIDLFCFNRLKLLKFSFILTCFPVLIADNKCSFTLFYWNLTLSIRTGILQYNGLRNLKNLKCKLISPQERKNSLCSLLRQAAHIQWKSFVSVYLEFNLGLDPTSTVWDTLSRGLFMETFCDGWILFCYCCKPFWQCICIWGAVPDLSISVERRCSAIPVCWATDSDNNNIRCCCLGSISDRINNLFGSGKLLQRNTFWNRLHGIPIDSRKPRHSNSTSWFYPGHSYIWCKGLEVFLERRQSLFGLRKPMGGWY